MEKEQLRVLIAFDGSDLALQAVRYVAVLLQPDKMDGLIKASQKCPQKRLLYVGKPTDEQKQAAAAAGPMTIAQADFKTTVDDMEWRG